METFQKAQPRKKYPTYEQLISNKLSFDKCSETTPSSNIQNICEFLKRMTELKKNLFSKLTEEEKE